MYFRTIAFFTSTILTLAAGYVSYFSILCLYHAFYAKFSKAKLIAAAAVQHQNMTPVARAKKMATTSILTTAHSI